MNRITITSLKVTAIGIAGSLASMVAAAKTAEVVYNVTEDYNKSVAAGTLVGAGGVFATIGIAANVADKDSEHYTPEDYTASTRIDKVLETASHGMKTVSNALQLASYLAH